MDWNDMNMSIEDVWVAIRQDKLDTSDFEQWVMDQRANAVDQYIHYEYITSNENE